MKPLQIALLIVAGAVGGAVVMKVVQRPEPDTAAAPAVAQNAPPAAQPPAAEQPAPPAADIPAPAPLAEPEAKPSPVPERPPIARPRSVHRQESRIAEPVQVAQAAPPAAIPEAAPQPQPAPQPVAPAPPPENVTPPPPPPPQPRQVTLNTGLLLSVRLVDALSSERNNPGDTFAGTLDQPLKVDGLVIAERGARVEGKVTAADRGSKIKGESTLSVELTRVHLSDGQTISIQTDSFDKHSEVNHNTDAAKVGGGAVIGAVIGAIAGGGKGAAIGAGAGGGLGAGDVLLTRKPATLPSETRITFRVNNPITVTERQAQ